MIKINSVKHSHFVFKCFYLDYPLPASNQNILYRITNYFSIVFEVHFLQDAGAVGADGGKAEEKFSGYILGRFTGCEHSHYLILPVGQFFM